MSGLVQLVSRGVEDEMLTGKPQGAPGPVEVEVVHMISQMCTWVRQQTLVKGM
jgi:hypothetical protein